MIDGDFRGMERPGDMCTGGDGWKLYCGAWLGPITTRVVAFISSGYICLFCDDKRQVDVVIEPDDMQWILQLILLLWEYSEVKVKALLILTISIQIS